MTHSRSDQPGAGATPGRQRRHDPAARHAPGRPRDADRRLPPARRRRPAYLLESVEGGERLGPLLVPRRRAAAAARGPRRPARDPDPARDRADLLRPTCRSRPSPATDPLAAIRAFVPRRRVQPTEGMPRFTGGAVGALAYDAVSAFEPTVPLPERDPVGVPTAAFIETDLVLVFDHLTHTLSAIASLHTEAPDLEGRYRIAEEAIFEALERTSRPSARRARTARERARGGRPAAAPAARLAGARRPVDTSLGRDEYIHAVEVAKDAIAAGEAIQVVLARRQSFDLPTDPATGAPLDGIGLYRALRRVNPSPYLFFVRTPTFEVVGASPELLLQVEGDKLTTHPIAGTRPRGADAREDALLAEELQARPEGAGRARDARRPRAQRPRPGRAGRAPSRSASTWRSSATATSSTSCRTSRRGSSRSSTRSTRCARSSRPARCRARPRSGRCSSSRRPRASGAGCTAAPSATSATTATSTPRSPSGARSSRTARRTSTPAPGSSPAPSRRREFEETEHKAAALRRAIEMAAGVRRGAARRAPTRPRGRRDRRSRP